MTSVTLACMLLLQQFHAKKHAFWKLLHHAVASYLLQMFMSTIVRISLRIFSCITVFFFFSTLCSTTFPMHHACTNCTLANTGLQLQIYCLECVEELLSLLLLLETQLY